VPAGHEQPVQARRLLGLAAAARRRTPPARARGSPRPRPPATVYQASRPERGVVVVLPVDRTRSSSRSTHASTPGGSSSERLDVADSPSNCSRPISSGSAARARPDAYGHASSSRDRHRTGGGSRRGTCTSRRSRCACRRGPRRPGSGLVSRDPGPGRRTDWSSTHRHAASAGRVARLGGSSRTKSRASSRRAPSPAAPSLRWSQRPVRVDVEADATRFLAMNSHERLHLVGVLAVVALEDRTHTSHTRRVSMTTPVPSMATPRSWS
jgi:hypothetical protein